MLIVPTGDLVGILSDVLPFAPAGKDNAHYGVLLEWDGTALHAHAADGLSAGISTYDPEDPNDFGEDNDQAWGPFGETPRWRVFVTADDVAEIVKTFKVPYKLRAIPLFLRVDETGARLTIERHRASGKTAHVMTVEPTDADRSFRDIRAEVERFDKNPVELSRIPVWAHRVAAFEQAGRRGVMWQYPVEMSDASLLVIRIGERFVGYTTLYREPKQSAGDVLRDGAGVMVS
jgi:hypothetical protein